MNKDFKDEFNKVLEKVLENFNEDELKNILEQMKEGNIFEDYESLMDNMYSYKAPSYSTLAKPMPDFMQKLFEATSIADVYTAYSEAKKRMQDMAQDEREKTTRNFLLNILAKTQNGEVDITNTNQMPLWAGMALVEKFDMKVLADTILEVLVKQNYKFYQCYIEAFEEDCEYIISKVCCGQLDTLSQLMHTTGFLPFAYPMIVNAVVLMAKHDRANRLKYLAWVSTTVVDCVEETLQTELFDRLIEAAAEANATELLPLLKILYDKYKILSITAPTYKDAENIIRNGNDHEYIQYNSLEELLNGIKEKKENDEMQNDSMDAYDDFFWDDDEDFFLDDEEDYFWDDIFITNQKNVDMFTLNVTLNNAPLEIMRQIEVPSNIRLDALAEILTMAMGWEGSHLNQFKANGKFYEETNYEEDAFYKEYGWKKFGQHEYSLRDLLNRKGNKILWEYDFGDSWEHSITLESRRKMSAYEEYAVKLLNGKNACPPEDVGGVIGYKHLLEVFDNPKSPEYMMMKDWVSPNFNPKKFSKAKTQNLIDDYLYE
ncbi:plasmid pRiA4b ORF-3 family protein [Prevotella sp.]|uniref:plasmid pRiA4b ORF-3 family protein n=1 Tax=Prevotella sp. TaxID=59823 RepID=UPI00307D0CAA